MFDGSRPVLIRIKNPTPGPVRDKFWYWTGAAWSVRKSDAKVFDCDYDAAVEVVRRNFKTAIVINVQPKKSS